MEKQFLHESRKRRHKSEFFVIAKSEGKLLKPKRLSCMRACELLQIEESQTQVANFLIEQILTKVFHSIEQVQVLNQMCNKQLNEQLKLLDSYELYSMPDMSEEQENQIRLEEEPKVQPNFKIIPRKDKPQQNSQTKDLFGPQFNKTNSSNSKAKFYSKQKLFKITNNLSTANQGTKSNHSIHSTKSNLPNSLAISYRYPKRIEEEIQNENEKDKRLREEIIKKLMRQHQSKLKENPHPCAEPLLHEYRSFFTQPESKEEQNLRVSYIQLRQLKMAQQKMNQQKTFKKGSILTTSQNSERSNANSIHLPKIQKSSNVPKKQEGQLLFSQDDNGRAIKVKNNQIVDTRQHSSTTYESYVKPHETALKEISNIYKPRIEYIKNDKIKDEISFLNENASLVSTLCQSMSMDEEMMDKSILQNFTQKKGVFLKKSMCSHRSSQSIELSAIKLPSIMKKK